MSTQEYGAVTGETRSARGKPSLFEMLRSLIKRNKKTSKDGIFELFTAEVEAEIGDLPHDSYAMVMTKYWFTRNYDKALPIKTQNRAKEKERQTRQTERATRLAAATAMHAATVQQQARVMLLDIVMRNGKKLRDCRGTECLKMGKEHTDQGNWLIAIGKEAGKDLVGAVLSEAQVAKLKAEAARQQARQ